MSDALIVIVAFGVTLLLTVLIWGAILVIWLKWRREEKAKQGMQALTEAAALVKRIEDMEEAEWCGTKMPPVAPEYEEVMQP